MNSEDYQFKKMTRSTMIFISLHFKQIILIDQDICHDTGLSYSEYTREQNSLMHCNDRLYRFVIENQEDLDYAKNEFKLLKHIENNDESSEKLVQKGMDRTDQAISPTPVEYRFEEAFLNIYGHESYNKVLRETSFPDMYGSERFYDYLIEIKEPHYFIAIEQNGEQYHHPASQKVGKKKYRSQLAKQNSFIAAGNKLFRWSIGGMIDKENFSDDIRRYLGSCENFLTLNHVKGFRKFKLYDHQRNLLEDLKKARLHGKNSFLIVLPTGTGKTAILIEDLKRLFAENESSRVLILEPTRALCNQVERVVKNSLQQSQYVDIHTNAWMIRNFQQFDSDFYDYVAVDEAHHAVAPSLKRVIQYFTPTTLLGMTATDKRLDAKKLETIFGQYDTHMTLKEAILKGILAPIHAFRIKSNLDLSLIRYNGKDYVHADLQKYVLIDSRDQLIVDVLNKYFSGKKLNKQGLVFCVSVAHANSLAKRMCAQGLPTRAVSGVEKRSAEYLNTYENGDIQFLTTCSLIHEGWDSPQTSVIVMARPTMSKVLYTQQLGRGTRTCEGKEALYVIDVVDNYGANKTPWSVQALTKSQIYQPWANIFFPENGDYTPTREELVLSGYYESERKIEQIDIFTFQEKYGDYLSTEQLARELYVSTGSVKSWIRKKQIIPDVTLPFGKQFLFYFDPENVPKIRESKGLTIHDDSTNLNDFYEFLDKGDYTFSYKIVFLLAFFALTDSQGVCKLDALTRKYTAFFKHRLDQHLPVDRKNCPYTLDFLNDPAKVQQSILANPFEKFERKRFMFHVKTDSKDCKEHPEYRDLNSISFSHILWEKIRNHEKISEIEQHMQSDLEKYYQELGGLSAFSFRADYDDFLNQDTYSAVAEKG